MTVLFFTYGLIFFIVGISCIIIALTNRTPYKFFDKIIYFGIFILLKGVVEWEHLFFPIKFQDLNNELFAANLGHRLFGLIAMSFLAVFGVELLVALYKRAKILRYLFAILYAVFFTYFFIYPGSIYLKDIIKWSLAIENASRQFVLLPGGLIAVLGIYLHANNMHENKIAYLSNFIFGLSTLTYSLLLGIFVFQINSHGSSSTFYQMTNIKLEVIEIILVFFMFGAILTSSYYLRNEYLNRTMKMRDVVLLGSERDRIARDMHDGAIQSLYGLSLRLGYMRHLTNQNKAEDIEQNITYVQRSVNEVIQDIRSYIYNNLAEEYRYENLEKGIKSLLKELKQTTHLEINFIYINKNAIELRQDVVVNIYFVIREAILNIIKHAQADTAEIKIIIDSQKMYAAIYDDGIGITKSNKPVGMGLATIRKRVEHLYGRFNLTHTDGTLLEIEIPLGEEKLDEQKSIIS